MASSPSLQKDYAIVDISQWLDGWEKDPANDKNDARKVILPLIDLRSYNDFDKHHLSFSPVVANGVDLAKTEPQRNSRENARYGDVTIVNLPLSTLLSGERSCELPPRHVEFAILVPSQYSRAFRNAEDEGRCSIHQLFFASRSKSTMQSRKPWLVRQVLMDEEGLWKTGAEKGVVQYREKAARKRKVPFQCLPRLWKPDPLISSEILPLLKEWVQGTAHACSNIRSGDITQKEKSVGIVLDLGSGAGRDICYLAEELKLLQQQCPQKCTRSIKFVGIDNHKGSAKRALPLWATHGVGDDTNTCSIDLKKLHLVRDHFMALFKLQKEPTEQSTILCIYAIRFLNRKLLSYIASSEGDGPASVSQASLRVTSKAAIHSPPPPLVLPLGTLVAISHFCKAKEGDCWTFDHPKESSVLNRWELKNLFGDVNFENANGDKVQRWKILKDDIVLDGDHGRTLIQFIVRKVA